MRDAVIITSLFCEASPLISAFGLKPMRDSELCARFQTFHASGVYIAISGIGKMRAAVTTAALLAHLQRDRAPMVVANVGIAGGSEAYSPRGTLVLANKVRDVATNTRYYPDVILKHPALELPLETYDAPVTIPPQSAVIVDMEGAGFMQAATTMNPPSLITVLKVVSDHCDGSRITPDDASDIISQHTETIAGIIYDLRHNVPLTDFLTHAEQVLLDRVIGHAMLSVSQRHELQRYVRAAAAQARPFIPPLERVLATSISTKDERRLAYADLLRNLQGDTLV